MIFADRVRETTSSTGTGTIDLAGAVTGFQDFVTGVGDGARVFYCIVGGAEVEVGIGVVTNASPDTLSRLVVLTSSNGGALVNFSAGTKDVFLTYPAAAYTTPRQGVGGIRPDELAELAWVNQDASTATLVNGFIVFSADNNGAEVHILKKAIVNPTGNWKVRCRISMGELANNERGGGLVLREAATGKLVILIIYKTAGSPGEGVYVFSWTDPSTFVAALGTPINLREDFQLHQAMFLEVEKVSNTLTYRVCPGDGAVGLEIHNQLKNVSFTTGPDEFGICGYSNGTGILPSPMAFTMLEQI